MSSVSVWMGGGSMQASSGANCEDWTNTEAFTVLFGNTRSVGSTWNSAYANCDTQLHLYCFEM